MITKLSVIGEMENGETRTASVSVKGRDLRNEDIRKLINKEKETIEPCISAFKEVAVWLEMKKNQWSKPYKVTLAYEPDLPFGTITDDIESMVMVADYEMAVGRFKDYRL